MGSSKKSLALMPQSTYEPALPHAAAAAPAGNSREVRKIRRKLEINQAIELAKGYETLMAGEIVDGLNEDLIVDGTDLIEFGVGITKDTRDPDAQPMVEQFVKKVITKGLNDHTRTTNIGIQGVQDTIRTPLDPGLQKRWPWE